MSGVARAARSEEECEEGVEEDKEDGMPGLDTGPINCGENEAWGVGNSCAR